MKSKATLRLGALIIVLVVLWLFLAALSWTSCQWYGYQTERETRYAAFVGCMVKMHDDWVPRSEIRTAN